MPSASPFALPEAPEVKLKEGAWFIPTTNPIYPWYERAMDTLQAARAFFLKSRQCPNCAAKGSVTETPRSIHCSLCSWTIDLSKYVAMNPKTLKDSLQKRKAQLQGAIGQIKYDTVYRELDLKTSFDTVKEKEDEVTKRLEDLSGLGAAKYILAMA